MSNIEDARKALIARILDGDGDSSREQRRAAFENARLTGPLATLVDKIATHAHRVTDDDFAAVRAAGLTEDAIYEIVVCSAVGQASRQLEAARAALAAVKEGA